MFRAFLGGTDITQLDELRRSFADAGEKGAQGGSSGLHSLFMDIYASMARRHMKMFGTTERQIAATAAKNHRHSTFNPLAQYRHDVTVDEVLADKVIAWPLTRAMCAPISDGAAAAVLVNECGLHRYSSQRAIEIVAIELTSGLSRAVDDLDRHLGRRAALAAYETAGIGPEDVDVAEVHDASAFAEIIQIENLGFCARGEGGALAEQGSTSLGGRIPINTSGGLVSKGHPIGATGLIQLHELVAQLRGEAGRRQVASARVAVAENGGGFIGVEEAATVVTVLKR
jgi:acetyl-CoA acetyltransferase